VWVAVEIERGGGKAVGVCLRTCELATEKKTYRGDLKYRGGGKKRELQEKKK
jgi:hypothetical protein